MGILLNVNCSKCGYQEDVYIGAGISFNKLEDVLSQFDEVSQKEIKKLVSDNPGKEWNVTKNLTSCNTCKKITSVAVFSITDGNKNVVSVISRCKCSAIPKIEENEEVISGKKALFCPKCKNTLKIQKMGNWD